MNDQHAKPGDTIKITCNVGHWLDKILIVIERPVNAARVEEPGDVWFDDGTVCKAFFEKGDYTIVKRANSPIAQDNDVDKSLKRQLNDNLRRAFGY